MGSKKVVEQVAKQVRDLYIRHRRRIHPNYKPHPRWKGMWVKIAALLLKHGIPPAEYINIQFTVTPPFPMPNHLAGAQALKMYKEHAGDSYAHMERRFIYEVGHFMAHLRVQTPQRILNTDPSTLSVTFRYCMAYRFNMKELCEELHDQALQHLMLDPNCYTCYEKYLPPELVEEFRQERLGGLDGECSEIEED